MSTTSVNVQIPSSSSAPVIADFVEHALRLAFLNREDLASLPKDDWEQPGVYVLLSGDGSGKAYVGKSTNLRTRLQNHTYKQPLDWKRAITVKRDTTAGFNTAEIGYLEGRLAAEIGAMRDMTIVEGQKSGDNTLPRHMQAPLNAFVKSLLSALRLSGVNITREQEDVDTDPDVEVTSVSGSAHWKVSLSDLVSDGLLQTGEELFLKQGTVKAKGTVTAEGEIVVEGVAHGSPSAAAKSALGSQSSNGWVAWRLKSFDGPELDTLRWEWVALQEEKAGVELGSVGNATPGSGVG